MTPPVTHLSMQAWADILGATGTQRLHFLPQMAACCDGRELEPDETVGAVNVGYVIPTCPACAVIADAAREGAR